MRKSVGREPLDYGYVTERRTSRYIERRVVDSVNRECPIVRLPNEMDYETGEIVGAYLLKRTGEKKTFSIGRKSRADNIRSVKERCLTFKWLVRANERDARLFVTLTYKENMRDTHRLYEDFRRFWMVLKRHCRSVYGYLVAFEPQERGAWHAHVILLSKNRALYISNRLVCSLWGHGYTKTQSCRRIKMLGNYITSYLTNVKDGNSTKKGARLSLYPSYFQFLRHSRNVAHCDLRKFEGVSNVISGLGEEYELLYDYDQLHRVVGKGFSVRYIRTRIFMFERVSARHADAE